MKQPTRPFCWFGRSSSRVDPVVSSHTRPSGHFSSKRRKVKFETFKHSGVCYVQLTRELNENPTQQPKMLTYLVIVFKTLCLHTWLHTALRKLWTHVLEPTDQLCVMGLNIWLSTSKNHSWLSNVLRTCFWSRRFTRAQLFVWSSRQNRQRKVF